MFGQGRPVRVKTFKDFRDLKKKKRYLPGEEDKLVKRIEKLEKRVAGLETMVLRTRGEFIINREKEK